MKTILGVIIAILLGVGLITNWFGLVASRPMYQYAEETKRLTESNSRRRIDGVNLSIADLCLNMRTSTDPATKRAFAIRLRGEVTSFQRTDLLTADNRACFNEAQTTSAEIIPVG